MATAPKSHSVWHEGELDVQRRAGVREEADQLTGMYKHEIPAGMAAFLAQQQFAVLSTVDAQGRVWASLVAGAPGIIDVRGSSSIALSHISETALPLDHIRAEAHVGLIAIDFSRRIRVRVNGVATIKDGDIVIAIDQLYGNCSQYIQKRIAENGPPAIVKAIGEAIVEPIVSSGHELSPAQCELISSADTFFIASRHPELGADASHRGGKPGFVEAAAKRLTFPDYGGNNMFNTLGNLTVNPAIGLLFFGFDSGRALQISGHATIDWNPERAAQFPLAQRVIDVAIEVVRDVQHATSLRYRFIGYSPSLG
jgi:hypothetical protein